MRLLTFAENPAGKDQTNNAVRKKIPSIQKTAARDHINNALKPNARDT